MLQYFLDNGLVRYSEKEVSNWQEAIRESCVTLIEKEMVDETYVEEIIQCVKTHGPYIVIVPNVAMPHSSEESSGVFGTGISFTKMKNEVIFDSPEEEKKASLFFTLAAKNAEEHMENIQNLSELLMTEGIIEDLMATKNLDDYKKLVKTYQMN